MIKNFESFLNESFWIPNFKAQGEFIGSKDAVSPEELEKIEKYSL